MTVRITCLVVGCEHTRGQRKGEPPITSGAEWICGDHWSAVSPDVRLAHTSARRRWKHKAGMSRALECERTWEVCKAEAIEKAAGI